jgi:hypothetical protein
MKEMLDQRLPPSIVMAAAFASIYTWVRTNAEAQASHSRPRAISNHELGIIVRLNPTRRRELVEPKADLRRNDQTASVWC